MWSNHFAVCCGCFSYVFIKPISVKKLHISVLACVYELLPHLIVAAKRISRPAERHCHQVLNTHIC